MANKAKKAKKGEEGRDGKLITALNHPLRRQILQKIMGGGKAKSPNELSKDLAQPLGNVSYHVKVLVENRCLRLVKTEPRRGAVEHFYKSIVEEDWAKNILGLSPSG